MFKFIKTRFSSMKLMTRLFISQTALFIFLLLIVFLYVDSANYKSITKAFETSSQNNISQTKDLLSTYITDMNNVTTLITLDSTMQSILQGVPEQRYGDQWMYQQFNEYNYILETLKKFESIYGFEDIKIYLSNGFLYSNENDVIYNIDKIDAPWLTTLNNCELNYMLFNEDYFSEYESAENKISYIGRIPSSHNIKETVGYLRIDVSAQTIHEIISNNKPYSDSISLIRNADDTTLISSSSDVLDLTDFHYSENITKNTLNSKNYFSVSAPLGITNTSIICLTPTKALTEDSNNLKIIILTIFIIIFAIFELLFYLISMLLTKRLNMCVDAINNSAKGILTTIDDDKEDDIGILVKSYNKMVYKINDLLDKRVEDGKTINEYNLKLLQAQINPHFLYNTLNMISIFITENRNEESVLLVHKLSDFYKLSLNGGADLLSLEDELRHAYAYFEISNKKIGDNIVILSEVDTSLYKIKVPKIILQPLIENAITHGILKKDTKSGNIIISAYNDENYMYLSVYDDGVGMDAEVFNQALHSRDNKNSYGLKNIDERLKLFYGDDCGISIESEANSFTIITLKCKFKTEIGDETN